MIKPADVEPTERVFTRSWPTYDTLRLNLKRAGIEWKDALGHVVRKAWQTLGVRYGINQRAAQEVFGHSDANRPQRSTPMSQLWRCTMK